MIPHITNEIKEFIMEKGCVKVRNRRLVIRGKWICERYREPAVSGSIRQVSLEQGKENCLFIHVTLVVPYIKSSGEHKSKPTQHSVRELRAIGISLLI